MNVEARPGSAVALARDYRQFKMLFDDDCPLCSLMGEGGA